MKKQITLLVSLTICLFSCGCLEMMTPAKVETATEQVQKLTESVDAYQKITSDAIEQARKDKLISEETVAKVDKINRKIDELQPIVVDAVTAVIKAEYSGDKFRDAVIGVQAANTATATVNPYAPIIDAATKILLYLTVPASAGGIYLAKRNSNKAKENKDEADLAKAKYKSHDQGKESAIKKLKTMKPEEITAEIVESLIFDDIGLARVRNKVA